jgi:hypothetical protein
MTEQLALIERDAPKVSADEVQLMLQVLSSRGWLRAEAVGEWAFSMFGVKWSDRKVRAIANASIGRIISYPGSPGYKLTLDCTPEEIEGAGKLKHQADEMTRRYVEIEKVWHARGRGAVLQTI